MVAIVSGNSLGLTSTSLGTLGPRGAPGASDASGTSGAARASGAGAFGTAAQGRSCESAYVNAATGNLIVQDRDDLLVGRGLDIGALRTYNSQGLLADDNGDNWMVGAFGRSVRLSSGTAGSAASTVTRIDRDGAAAVYAWNAGTSRYVSTAGGGAFDTIAFDASDPAAGQWVWTDGDSARVERYESSGQGRLQSATDADGNTVRLAYNASPVANGNLQSVTSANGDVLAFDYAGNNLLQIRSVTGGVATTTVRYGYDASNRLASVTVDLTPEDNAVADGKTYVTRYTYDGASRRVASIAEADGTGLAFTYVQVGSSYKVQSVTDALGAVTTFGYDTAKATTTVTDPLGAASVYLYDAEGQLVQVRQGVTATNAAGLSQVSYAYDASGNVTRITDGAGNTAAMSYDARGNLLGEVDSAGDTRTSMRGYPLDPADRLLGGLQISQVAGIDGRSGFQRPEVLQNVDRWGNVVAITDPRSTAWKTTYRYNANNQLIQQVQTDSDGNAGVSAQGVVNANAPVTTITYDKLGRQLAVRDANGHVNGNVYDSAGQLVQEVHADGGVVSHAYDAFGDKTRTIDAMGNGTWFLSDKLGRLVKTIHQASDTHAWGALGIALVSQGQTSETQKWDQAGRLLSQTNGNGETIKYGYDLRGNLISTTQPMGQTTRAGFDANNRKVIEVDGNGAVATWKYDGFGRLQGHTDIGKASYAYTYDNAMQLVAQGNSRGQNIGYNPATGKNLNLVQRRDGRIDALINVAATVVTGGASTATRAEVQAMKTEMAAAQSSRRAELNAKFDRSENLDQDINARGASSLRSEVDRLVAEGHAVGRHGERVTEAAIDNRALNKFDPITGSTTDFVTGGVHRVGTTASQFTANRALLNAEAYVRGSPEFASAQANAGRNLDDQFAVKGLRLEDALGPNYLSQVYGKTRTGPVGTGNLAPTDFTDGTITGIFRQSSTGNWNLHTLYPNPKP